MRGTSLLLYILGWLWGLLAAFRSIGVGFVKAFSWGHRRIYQPVAEYVVETLVGLSEEYAKSVVREWFNFAVRLVNGCSSWVVSRFDSTFYRKQRRPSHWDFATWENWRPSTFNWLIERENHERKESEKGGAQVNEEVISGGENSAKDGKNVGFSEGLQKETNPEGEDLGPREEPAASWNVFGLGMRRRRRSLEEGSNLARAFQKVPDAFGSIGFTMRRGWMEDCHMGSEMAITRFFDTFRKFVRRCFLLPNGDGIEKIDLKHSKSEILHQDEGSPESTAGESLSLRHLPRIQSSPACSAQDFKERRKLKAARPSIWEKQSSNANRFISESGYPLEDHDVLTEDGYILTLHRLPRPKSKDAVFFQHGILDTSMSWCANGVAGSLAFQAYEAGFDVWLGNCRANPPRRHGDPKLAGHKYWGYSLNELGLKDIGAQLEFIHKVKCRELETAREGIKRWKAEYGGRNSIDIRCEESPTKQDGVFDSPVHDSGTKAVICLSKSSGALEGGETPHPGSPDSEESQTSRIGLGHSTSDPVSDDQSDISSPDLDPNLPDFADLTKTELDGDPIPHPDSDEGGADSDSVCGGEGLPVVDSENVFFGGERPQGEGEEEVAPPPLPYRLRAVGHSLGGAAMLIYLVMSLYRRKPHYLSRLVLLSPAGFHHKFPALAYPFIWLLPVIEFVWRRVLRKKGVGVMIPGRYPRKAVFKGLQDVMRIPGLRGILNLIIRGLLGGDRSPWDFAMQLPHYDEDAMPGISLHSGLHLIQFVKTKKFSMFDYGDREIHMHEYGKPEPIDLAAEYDRIDIPVDIAAGTKDGVIPPDCVKSHVRHMREGGVNVSYKEFDYSHLEFSFTVPDDLTSYVIDRLNRKI
ncbi:hypothetical protein BSKO_06237 [Bryopsis sp. KO-2023]|nr:hypothetical protein BSKO_06237 [Bryopsis sp. KO-2023]